MAARFRCHDAPDLLGCVPALALMKEYGDRVFAVRAEDETSLGKLGRLLVAGGPGWSHGASLAMNAAGSGQWWHSGIHGA